MDQVPPPSFPADHWVLVDLVEMVQVALPEQFRLCQQIMERVVLVATVQAPVEAHLSGVQAHEG